jgi:hypothetical protein
LFVGGTAMTYIVMHTLALPAITLGAAITAPVAIAALYASKSAFDITCSMRVLFKHIREKRAAKKTAKAKGAEAQPATAPVPAAQPAPANMPAPLQPSFAESAAPKETPPAPPPAKPTVPPPQP